MIYREIYPRAAEEVIPNASGATQVAFSSMTDDDIISSGPLHDVEDIHTTNILP